MRPRTILMLVALVCVVAVIGVVMLGLQAPPQQAAKPQHPENVVVAANPIPVGTLIKPQDLTFGPPPADTLPAATFDRVWSATNNNDEQLADDNKVIAEVVGAVTRHRIEAGEPVNRGAVVKPGDSGFLAAVLRPGMRAITVAVTAVTGTGGLIYPGDHVDMILTQSMPTTAENVTRKSVGETVADDLRVLAIDQQLQIKATPDGQQPNRVAQTVTLEVRADQAQKIAVAEKLGELSLTIRSLQSADTQVSAGEPAPGAPLTTPASVAPGKTAAGTGPGTTPSVPQTADASNQPTWADDVSPALKIMEKAAHKDDKPPVAQKPAVMVIRGDKADEVGVH